VHIFDPSDAANEPAAQVVQSAISSWFAAESAASPLNFPNPQRKQSSAADDRDAGLYFPATQISQPIDPIEIAYLPASQITQTFAPSDSENLPTAQTAQSSIAS
jgi:hypothetical protein